MANAEITVVREFLARLAIPPDISIPDLRGMYEQMTGGFPTAPDIAIERVKIGEMAAEFSRAETADAARTILYLHGGGYVIGSLNTHRALATELGRAAGGRTLAIDYRLGPEHAFPAAVDDAVAAYRWLIEQQDVAPGRLAIAGDSAGGGLTVAALVAIRDAGLPLPAAGFCISPWVDLEATGGSMTAKADEDPMISAEGLLNMARGYLQGQDPRSPLAAPLYADLRGLPPLLIQVGSAEALLDDAIRLAAVAGAAETRVTLEVWPEMIHVWHAFAPMLTDGRRAIAEAGAWLAQRFH